MSLLSLALLVSISAVVFVNGWTDAPNAITGIVTTGAMPYKKAVRFASVLNLLGLLVMGAVNSSVTETVTNIVDLSAYDTTHSLIALLSAMITIVVFAVVAWFFGIPTSESHALIASLVGAAICLGGVSNINADSVYKVLMGLLLSIVLGFWSGFGLSKAVGKPLSKATGGTLDRLQIFSGGGMAFMHGAQDGQKFIAIYILADMLMVGSAGGDGGNVSVLGNALLFLLCAALMALGTSVGGKKIIDTVGVKMVSLEKHTSVSADFGSAASLLVASFMGVPMSTTHTKTTAIMGACMANKKNPTNYKVISEMFVTWAITFPFCIGMGFIVTKLLCRLFAA